MARLGVNIEYIAILRGTDNHTEPDPVTAAGFAELAGCDGIVCPLREELYPVKERDLKLLKEMVKTHLNVQIPPEEKIIEIALSYSPDMITLVPGDKPGGMQGNGLDVMGHEAEFAKIVEDIRSQNIVTSIMVDPNIHQIKSAAKVGGDFIELNTGPYAEAEDYNQRIDILENLSSSALAASKLGLGVAVSCGLNYTNILDIVSLEKIEEINIGHAIVTRAVWIGMENAVRDMMALVR